MAATMHALLDYWSDQRGDNFSTATDAGARSATEAGYRRVRVEGMVWQEPLLGSEPLTLWWSSTREDNFTAPPSGTAAAVEAGYARARVEGYVEGRMPLDRAFSRYRSWWHAARQDNYLSGSVQGDADARAAGYELVHVADCFGPAQKNIALTWSVAEGAPANPIRLLNGVGFTPGGTVRALVLDLAPGLDDPVEDLGTVQADGKGRCGPLPQHGTKPPVPGSRRVTVIVDESSRSEIAMDAATDE